MVPFSHPPPKKSTMAGRLSMSFQPGGKWTNISSVPPGIVL